jgi:hypothetical protein
MSNNTISASGTSGVHGNLVNFLGSGTAVMVADVAGGSYTGNSPNTANGLHFDTAGGTMNVTVTGGTLTNNFAGINVSTSSGGDLTFDINGASVQGSESHALNLFMNASSTGSATGKFRNNLVGTSGVSKSGSEFGYGIRVQNEATATNAPATVLIDNNTVEETFSFSSINVNQGIATGTPSPVYITATNNKLNHSAARGIAIQQTNTTASPGTMCVDMSANVFGGNIIGQAGDGTKLRLDQNTGGVFQVRQTSQANLISVNTGLSAAQISEGGTITYNGTGGAACPQP